MPVATPFIFAVSGLFLFGFAVNEATHGGMSEAVGTGHHHMLDHGGYHCAGPNDGAAWQHHVDHMHDGNTDTMPHTHCGGGHMNQQGHHGMGA